MTHGNARKKGFFNLGRHWPYVIVLMLLVHASLMIGTIIYVAGKHDTYVDPEYYAKSVDWDAQRAMKEAAKDQGWSVQLTAKPIGQDPTQRSVELELLDAQGVPITDALVEMTCFHPAELADRYDAVMLYEDGVYARTLPIEREGIWVAEISIQRQGVRALLTKDLDIVSIPRVVIP